MEYTADTKNANVSKIKTEEKMTFWTAFQAAKKEFEIPKRTGYNGHFDSHFSTLTDVMDAVTPSLEKHGLVLFQAIEVSITTGAPLLRTIIRHVGSGTEEDSTYPLFTKDQTPQALGGSITYAKRYAITTLLGLLSEEDDDGNRASITKKATQALKPTTAAPKTGNTLGQYRVTFGKFKGHALESIPPEDIANYVQFLTSKGDLNGPAEEFVSAASDYLEESGYSDL